PKAANVSHLKLMRWSRWFAGMLDMRPDDRLYNCLPLYHSVGGVAAAGAALTAGGSIIVRKRFSASRFWHDLGSSQSTLFCYVGELCRYLVNSPVHPAEHSHRLRACFGNGMRADVWQAFKTRFEIPQIVEFYASTEGSFSLFNAEGEVGSIGRIPPYLSQRDDVALIKVDVETGSPLFDPQGRCIRCDPDEAGEAIGRLHSADTAPGSAFEGYLAGDDGKRKILCGAFRDGDAWFRTGDLMRKDGRGFFFFVDRMGDTFRWKGENVSTQEVETSIAACAGVREAIVYGVRVPGTEGRAGMAAIVPHAKDFDLAVLYRHLAKTLAPQARPLFVRICKAIETTETFKPMKQKFARDGYDTCAVTDPIYVSDRRTGRFVALTPSIVSELPAAI
ncbi:MAG TPA: AMP-binding protein, partial [Rhizomicrobium sp.]|nr:AMP-binding protein [Rhizomicrobium sp.]